jgi:hypothetical protein
MLTKGAVLIGGVMASQIILDKLEASVNKREIRKSKEKDSEKEVEITEEEVAQAFEIAWEDAKELNAENVK